ncbi:multiple monosaccharide ABC transporter permease [Myceligenerans xiligouense]|uniref:Xylose transport system permease protein XylH n=1 Tax=Myceligenerans xiligouense TaxID=253184 RepID=A0A3N4YTM4_9MICO|nr:multiple monosaccharide ABC transporter permease [Myceligenerans xiligouense]RPF22724.1 putative multiple sugar transport system permease protein [Myceligenerans xiligouense]
MNDITEYLGRNARQYGIVIALLAIVALFQGLTGGRLLDPSNVVSLIQQNAYVLILAIGMVMVIVAGHIDLSVGSVVAFIGGATAIMMADWGWSWPVAIALALVLGLLVGSWQGFWIAYVGIPAFIVTLAGMLIFRGLAIVIVGTTRAGLPPEFNAIAGGALPSWLGFIGALDGVTVLIGVVGMVAFVFSQWRARRGLIKHDLAVEPMGIFLAKNIVVVVLIGVLTYWIAQRATPIVLLIVGGLIMVFTFVLSRTVFGRHIYAVGGNRHAAELSGVRTRVTDFMIFVNMGLLAAVAAIVTTSRAGAGVASAGQLYELDAIAACFIGGCAVRGGVGKISGAMIGALIMGVLNMGLSILAVDSAWQQTIKGLVLLLAVALDVVSKRRRAYA